jgi:hypothetical protein
MNAEPKRQHTTPRLVLKEFAHDGDGNLFAFDCRTPDRGVFSEHYEKLLIRKHFYSFKQSDGTKDPSPEVWLSKLESLAAPLFVRIIDAARTDKLTGLTGDDMAVLKAFTYHQWKRAPETITATLATEFDNALDRSLAEFESTYRRLTNYEREQIFAPEFKERLKHNTRVDVTVQPASREVVEAFDSMGLHVVRIDHPRKSFVTGSSPVAKLSHPGAKIGGPDVEFWLAVSHDVALVWAGPPMVRFVRMTDERFVRNTNTAVARQSTVIAGKSKELIASLVKAEQMHKRGA